MTIGVRVEVGRGEAQAVTSDARRYENADDDMTFPLAGWEPPSAKEYYIDLDDVIDEVNAPN